MANYQYDEGGGMAEYFILTLLSLILIPMSFSSLYSSGKKPVLEGCQCTACIKKREQLRKKDKASLFNPKFTLRGVFTTLGWIAVVFFAYRVSTKRSESKLYDPFEILGIRAGTSEKEIKSHYKKLSRKFHPDKVKLAINQTAESVAEYFVDITKAYKSLTDETIRRNWELYGHPDGRQEIVMGIAIPSWVIQGKYKFAVLVVYGLLIGGLLPWLVGRWWYGSRTKTKDGVYTKTAEVFFKNVKEEAAVDDLYDYLGQVFEWESPKASSPLGTVEEEVRARLGGKYQGSRALTLLYAHLFRIDTQDAKLQKEQHQLLLRTPAVLASLLNITLSHNWLLPTLSTMRLGASLVQALPLNTSQSNSAALKFAQLPGFTPSEAEEIMAEADENTIPVFLDELQRRDDRRLTEAKKVAERWGRLEVVDISFKVVGERIVTPSAMVHLVAKLRINPPGSSTAASQPPETSDSKSGSMSSKDEDEAFISTRKDAEDLSEDATPSGWAHAPHWPVNRKAGWWMVLADDKTNRVVVPPLKIHDVPFSDPSKERNYRSYQIQFQAPTGVGMYTWKVYFVSDTFVGEEEVKDITLNIEDISALKEDERGAEDEISDPEEDSLAGQMAAMRGGKVKKSLTKEDDDEESDEESDTDGDKGNNDSSDSDSDSD